MEQPLGRAVGNAIEVIESIEFLKGNMTADIKQLTYEMVLLHFANWVFVTVKKKLLAK